MNMKRMWLLALAPVFVVFNPMLAIGQSDAEMHPGTKSVFVNYDSTHFAYWRTKAGIVPGEPEIRELVRQYRGTDVTDILFDLGGQIASVSNSAKECWCDKYHQTKENGRTVSYTNHFIKLYVYLEEVCHLDRYALWCDEAHKCGIHPWLSFRMNDCHDPYEQTSILHPNFFYDHPEYRRIRHREPKGYFERCYDYSFSVVRERELKYIGEMLERYDADGVELDWMRECYCFAPGQEDHSVITEFTRRVRALAAAAERRRGHPVRVMARVPTDPETALRFGLDVATWADEKIIDVVAPSPRWKTTDNEIAVDCWKRLLRGTNVRLVTGLERGINDASPYGPGAKHLVMTMDQIVGAAAAHYSAGADGIYLFNYFDHPNWKKSETQSSFLEFECPQPLETMGCYWPTQLKWLAILGHPEKVFAAPRSHMLTSRDMVPLWESHRYPFPTTVLGSERDGRFFRINTGNVPSGAKLELRIGVKDGKPPRRVFVNSRPCTYVRNEPCVPAFTDDPLCVYSLAPYPENAAVVEIIPDEPTTITHLELNVK